MNPKLGTAVWGVGLMGILGLMGGGQPLGAGEPSEKIGVRLVLEADKRSYVQGEPILLTLRVVNRSPRPVTLHFRSAQRYELAMEDPQGHEVWRWSAAQLFAQVLGTETLRPSGGEILYRVAVRERFPPGRYMILAIISAEEGPLTATLEIRITM